MEEQACWLLVAHSGSPDLPLLFGLDPGDTLTPDSLLTGMALLAALLIACSCCSVSFWPLLTKLGKGSLLAMMALLLEETQTETEKKGEKQGRS